MVLLRRKTNGQNENKFVQRFDFWLAPFPRLSSSMFQVAHSNPNSHWSPSLNRILAISYSQGKAPPTSMLWRNPSIVLSALELRGPYHLHSIVGSLLKYMYFPSIPLYARVFSTLCDNGVRIELGFCFHSSVAYVWVPRKWMENWKFLYFWASITSNCVSSRGLGEFELMKIQLLDIFCGPLFLVIAKPAKKFPFSYSCLLMELFAIAFFFLCLILNW